MRMATATETTPEVLAGEGLEQTRVEEVREVRAKAKVRAAPAAVAAANPE